MAVLITSSTFGSPPDGLLISQTGGITLEGAKEMTPTTKKIWQSHEAKKTKSLIDRQAQLHHIRRSYLAKDTIKRIILQTKLARKRYSVGMATAPGAKLKNHSSRVRRRRVAHRQRRRRDKALRAVVEEIHKAQQEATRRTHAQSIACFGRVERICRKENVIASKHPPAVMTNPETIPSERGAVNTSLPRGPTGVQTLPTARSVSHLQTTTRHVAHSTDRLQNRSQSGGPGASLRTSLDFASDSSSQARHKMSWDAARPKTERQTSVSITHRSLPANDTHPDNSLVPRSGRDAYHFGHKRRKTSESSSRNIHLGHHGYVAEDSQDVAHVPRQGWSHPTASMHRVGEPLRTHVGKDRAKSENPERGKKDLSVLFHTSATGNKKLGLPNKSKTTAISAPNSDAREDAEEHVETEKLVVNIPADTDMATDVRAYSQWPDDSGALKNAHGCLLPARYRFSDLPDFEWICPVRTCRRCFQSQSRLGSHFSGSHYSCLLNDNRDGTFTILGKYAKNQNGTRRPPLVQSKNPLPKYAPPIMEPQPPATWAKAQQRELFAASQRKARLRPAPDPSQEESVDEMMLLSSCMAHVEADTPGSSESKGSPRTPSPRGFEERRPKPKAYSGNVLRQPLQTKLGNESTRRMLAFGNDKHANTKHMPSPRDATEENWELVKPYLTDRHSHSPKRGHFATLLSSPRSRDIVTRPGERFIADQPRKIRLLMVHMTGQEAPVPCDSCASGRGPFKKCIAISTKAAGETTNGIVCCTNCASNKESLQHSCNVEELLSQSPGGQTGSPLACKQRKVHATPERREQAKFGISPQITEVDNRFTFAVHVLPLDGSLDLDAAPSSVRLCSLTSGKALVELEGNSPFLIGPHGMFKVMPVTGARISNASDTVTVVHVSTVKN